MNGEAVAWNRGAWPGGGFSRDLRSKSDLTVWAVWGLVDPCSGLASDSRAASDRVGMKH